MSTYKYDIICICLRVFIPYHIVDYYVNTIGDMQNELDFFYQCKMFEYIHDFEQFFWKNDDALLEYVILDSDDYLYEIDYYKFLL